MTEGKNAVIFTKIIDNGKILLQVIRSCQISVGLHNKCCVINRNHKRFA